MRSSFTAVMQGQWQHWSWSPSPERNDGWYLRYVHACGYCLAVINPAFRTLTSQKLDSSQIVSTLCLTRTRVPSMDLNFPIHSHKSGEEDITFLPSFEGAAAKQSLVRHLQRRTWLLLVSRTQHFSSGAEALPTDEQTAYLHPGSSSRQVSFGPFPAPSCDDPSSNSSCCNTPHGTNTSHTQ
jgi:hypothetical protein